MTLLPNHVAQTSPNRFYGLLSPRISGTEYPCNVNLMIECGRCNKPRKIPFHDRLCQFCHTIEDEYHIIIECPRFSVPRKKYIPNNVTTRPRMFELINFVNNVKDNQLSFPFSVILSLISVTVTYDSNI